MPEVFPIVVLTLDEMRVALIDWQFDALVNDPSHLKKLIAEGTIDSIPHFPSMSYDEACNMYSDIGIGIEVAAKYGARAVYGCASSDNEVLHSLWFYDNLSPEERDAFDKYNEFHGLGDDDKTVAPLNDGPMLPKNSPLMAMLSKHNEERIAKRASDVAYSPWRSYDSAFNDRMNKEIQAINELGWLDPPGSVSRLRDFERMAFQKYGLPNRMLPCRKSRRTLGEFEERY